MELNKNFYTLHKFGGSSLADAKRFNEVKKILAGNQEVIVVSATKGTTTQLQNMLDAARDGKTWHTELSALESAHQTIINALLPQDQHAELFQVLRNDFATVADVYNTVAKIGAYSSEIQDFILGYGEQWSAQILTAYLNLTNKTLYLDASKVLYCYKKDGVVCIDWERSQAALIEYLKDNYIE